MPAERVARIPADFLARERRTLGESWFRQEYCCSFEALEGLVYPDFALCLVPSLPSGGGTSCRLVLHPAGGDSPAGQRVGGIDFGFRNPFAAVWGVLDRDDVLWLTGEHYCREQPLAYHLRHLPRDVTWYADPEGAREIHELRLAGLVIRKADNERRPGIAAVRARMEDGTLRVLAGACPNLLAEAGLYRYDSEARGRSEVPVKEHDHALDALRYLLSRTDARRLARLRGARPAADPGPEFADELPAEPPAPPGPKRPWLSVGNEFLWHPIR